MLTSQDLAEIKRLIGDTVAAVEESHHFGEPHLTQGEYLPAVVDIVARAIEVLGTREKALRWLKAPVRSLGDQTPLSLLDTPEGITRVEDALGSIEHGVW
jgi:putative toxin-antitoxin system antitoxin component (TIGR02293 family)